jgi:hypothetical protein
MDCNHWASSPLQRPPGEKTQQRDKSPQNQQVAKRMWANNSIAAREATNNRKGACRN